MSKFVERILVSKLILLLFLSNSARNFMKSRDKWNRENSFILVNCEQNIQRIRKSILFNYSCSSRWTSSPRKREWTRIISRINTQWQDLSLDLDMTIRPYSFGSDKSGKKSWVETEIKETGTHISDEDDHYHDVFSSSNFLSFIISVQKDCFWFKKSWERNNISNGMKDWMNVFLHLLFFCVIIMTDFFILCFNKIFSCSSSARNVCIHPSLDLPESFRRLVCLGWQDKTHSSSFLAS